MGAREKWPEVPRALVSYAYMSGDQIPTASRRVDLLIDSGAFTAHQLGKKIDRDTYTEFLLRNQGKYRAAFALDVIGSHSQSIANFKAQRRELPSSVQLIPTWHIGSPIDDFKNLLSQSDYVAIGGAVPHSSKQRALMRTFIACHKLARQAGVRVHGLGQTSAFAMKLPWESVDSSSWTYARRYPMILLANESGRIISLKRGTREVLKYGDLLRKYGLNPVTVSNKSATLPKYVGAQVANRRIREYTISVARSYIYTEACSHFSTKVYLAGSPSDINDFIIPAFKAGNPFCNAR